MSVNSSGIPLFAGVEDIEDMFIATMEEMDKDVESVITIKHPLWQYYQDKGRIEYRDSIGTHIPTRLLDKPNSTVKSFTHYDDVDNTPQDALSEAKVPYGHIIGTQMYSREELVKNSGPEQLIDMVETKTTQLNESMTNFFASKVMGSQAADGRIFAGLGLLMDPTQAWGGINPTQNGFAYWAPQQGLKSNGGQYSLATEMRPGMRRLLRLCSFAGEDVDVVVCGEDLFEAQLENYESKIQTVIGEKKLQGDSPLMFTTPTGITYIYEPALPAKRGWAINTKKTPIRIHKGTNFTYGPWEKVPGKEAKARNCMVYAAIYTKRRNYNGVIDFT